MKVHKVKKRPMTLLDKFIEESNQNKKENDYENRS